MSIGNVRTFFVFLNLPTHYEFLAGEIPLLEAGTEIQLKIALRNPKNPKAKVREIDGVYFVTRRSLVFSNEVASRTGLSQYLELAPRGGG